MCRAGDAEALARLSGELGYPATPAQISERLKQFHAEGQHTVFLAENSAAKVLGWVHVSRYRTLVDDARAEILGIVSDPTSRRRGIGRALMLEAEKWAGSQGLKLVSLRSNIKRTEAHRFYERIGCSAAKTQLNYRKRL